VRENLEPIESLIMGEERRLRCLQRTVDRTLEILRTSDMSWEEAKALIMRTRDEAVGLFPDKGHVFDLVCKPRFYRVLDEKMRLL
jgi:hypothetical protein